MSTLVGLLKAMNEKKMTSDELSKGLDKELATYNDADAKRKKEELDKFEMATFADNRDPKTMKRGTFDKTSMNAIPFEIVMVGIDGLKGKKLHTYGELNPTAAGQGSIDNLEQTNKDKSYDDTSYTFTGSSKITLTKGSFTEAPGDNTSIFDDFKDAGAKAFVVDDKYCATVGDAIKAINDANIDDLWVVGNKTVTAYEINNQGQKIKLKLMIQMSDLKK